VSDAGQGASNESSAKDTDCSSDSDDESPIGPIQIPTRSIRFKLVKNQDVTNPEEYLSSVLNWKAEPYVGRRALSTEVKFGPYTLAELESSVKDACDAIESQFSGYSSLKAVKSKDAPKSGPVFDEFTAVNEIVQALESNSKKLKSAVQAVLENFNKLLSALSSFEKKTEATVSKIQEKLLSISATWEGKFNDAFKKYGIFIPEMAEVGAVAQCANCKSIAPVGTKYSFCPCLTVQYCGRECKISILS
jgi:hypothetical protein